MIWTCELEGCNETFKRYPSQVKSGEKRYCCQSHAGLQTWNINRERYLAVRKSQRRSIPSNSPKELKKIRNCQYCKKEFTNSRKDICSDCRILGKRTAAYGITVYDYFTLVELQDHKCAVCRVEKCQTGKSWCIDHDHETGRVRGLLCYKCNSTLGWFEPRLDTLLKYLHA